MGLESISWSSKNSTELPPPWPSSIIPHPQLVPFSHFILTQLSPTVNCCVGFEVQRPPASCQLLAIHRDPIIISQCCSFVLIPTNAIIFVLITIVVVVNFVVVLNIGILQCSSFFCHRGHCCRRHLLHHGHCCHSPCCPNPLSIHKKTHHCSCFCAP